MRGEHARITPETDAEPPIAQSVTGQHAEIERMVAEPLHELFSALQSCAVEGLMKSSLLPTIALGSL